MLHLTAWGSAQIRYELPSPGKRPRIRLNRNGERANVDGLGSFQPMWYLLRRFYAVYALDDRFIFQAGRRFWDLTEGPVEARFYTMGFGIASGIALYHGGNLIHRAFLFHPARALFARLDPTYDFLEAESDHFFFFLRNQIHKDEWRRHICGLPETLG